MNKCALVLGAVAIATLAGCKDPDYKYGDEQSAQNQVKTAEPTPAPPQPIVIESAPVAKCTCPSGTKHTSPCTCGAPDCRCIVEPQKVIVAEVKAPTPPAAAATTTYIVQRGDTLSKISKKYNIRIDAILKANPKIKNNMIRIGHKLTLPIKVDVGVQTVPAGAFDKSFKAAKKPYVPYSGATRDYIVKNGDTLGAIAYANGISIRQLKELNGLSSNSLRIGQKLKIPVGNKATAAAKKAPAKPAAAKLTKPASAAPEAPKASEAAVEKPAENSAAPEIDAALEEVDKAPATDTAPAVVVEQTKQAEQAAPQQADPQQADPKTMTYVVTDGDDMAGICIRWAVSAARIRELNNLSDDAQLMPGQILKIPVENQQ